MLYINTPSREEFLELAEMRSDVCVSIYLKTSPLIQENDASRIDLSNQLKAIFKTLEERAVDKRRLEDLADEIYGIVEDDDFWAFHANSLAILATPDCIRTYRMANNLETRAEIADRFYLKPLLRAMTFPYAAYVLAISENGVRLIETLSGASPEEIKVPGMPKDAPSSVGKSKLTASLGGMTHESGTRGRKMHLVQYSRKINDSLRSIMATNSIPVFLVGTEPLVSIFRSVASISALADETVFTSPDALSLTQLADQTKHLLTTHNEAAISQFNKLFVVRSNEGRTVTDLADIAKAATYGMISDLVIDFNATTRGNIGQDGVLSLSNAPENYNVVDEIARRALMSGARVMALRQEEMQHKSEAAAVLRYSF